MVSTDPDRVAARRRLGVELQKLRTAADLSGSALADRLGWSQSKVSRIESARIIAAVDDVRALLKALEAPRGIQRELLDLAAASAGSPTDRRNSSGSGLTRRQQDFIALEASASSILHYQPLLFPGYLQTEAYARRVIEMVGVSSVEQAVEQRLSRRLTLTKPNAPQYQIVLLETVLRWRPVFEADMVEQLQFVARLASLPNVDLRIVAFDRKQQACVQHALVIFNTPGKAEGMIELTNQDIRVTDVAALGRLRCFFEKLYSSAMPPADSLAFINAVAGSYDDTSS